jgi:hypothetical protein
VWRRRCLLYCGTHTTTASHNVSIPTRAISSHTGRAGCHSPSTAPACPVCSYGSVYAGHHRIPNQAVRGATPISSNPSQVGCLGGTAEHVENGCGPDEQHSFVDCKPQLHTGKRPEQCRGHPTLAFCIPGARAERETSAKARIHFKRSSRVLIIGFVPSRWCT